MLGSSALALAQGLVFVDAIGGGLPGGDNLAPSNAIRDFQAANFDNLWGTRSFGSGGALFTAGDGDGTVPAPDPPDTDENVPEITQTISGLTNGVSYDIYAAYWSATNADWGVRAGLSSNPGGNQWFNRTGDAVDTVASVAGAFAGAAYFETPPQPNADDGLYVEGNRQMYLAKLGSATASGGQVVVYLDDLSTEELAVGDIFRTWFDGLAYVPNGGGSPDVIINATLDRGTGNLSIDFTNPNGPNVVSYSIASPSGSLNPAGWNSIANGSNSSLDPGDTWTASGTDVELTESETAGSGGFSLNTDVNFGSVWRDSPFDDLSLTLTLDDATEFVIPINLGGDGFAFGDLTFDGAIDSADFQVVINNLLKPIDTVVNDTQLEQYKLGDLTGDAAVNYADVVAFRQIFNSLPAGQTAGAATPTPEPAGVLVLAISAVAAGLWGRRRPRVFAMVVCLCAFGWLLAPQAALAQGPLHLFDIDGEPSGGNNGPTLDGWTSYTNNAPPTAVTDPFGVSLTITGVTTLAGDGRNRGTSATEQGIDNNDNPVPEGEFAALYQDFIFARGANVMTAAFTGLLPDTTYTATVWSYDSGAFGGTAVTQDFLVNSAIVAELDYSGDLGSGLGPDPNTDFLTDYSVMFDLTTNGSGAVSFTTVSDGSQGARLNGIRLAIPSDPLTLEVNRTSGLVRIKNPTDFDIPLDYYELRSDSGSLDFDAWVSLDDQDTEPDNLDAGWNEAGGSDDFVLAEVRGLDQGATTVSSVTGSLSLGNAFSVGGTEDLTFQYGLESGDLVSGIVTYIDGGDLFGDYNGDLIVDVADYTVWRDNLGQSITLPGEDPSVTPGQVTIEDYNVWRSNFGETAALVAPAAAPEPCGLALLAAGLGVTAVTRRR